MHSAELVPVSATVFGRARSDIFYLVKANRLEADRWRLTDDELAPQLW
jgi:hypothetical protein